MRRDLQPVAQRVRAEIARHANGCGVRALPEFEVCVDLMMNAYGMYRRQAVELLWPYTHSGQWACCRLTS